MYRAIKLRPLSTLAVCCSGYRVSLARSGCISGE